MEIPLDVMILDNVAAAVAEKFLILMVPVLSLSVWLYFSIFCHELGHLVCAKLAGLPPCLMKVGSGFSISIKRFFGAQLELGVLPTGGLTRFYYPDKGWSKFEDLKLKLIIFYIGGCLANSVLLACLTATLVYTGLLLLRYLIIIEAVIIIGNLIPMDCRLYGKKIPSDGKNIFFILTKNYRWYFSDGIQNEVARMAGDLAKSQPLFKNDMRSLELLVKADTVLNYLRFDEAIALYNQLLNAENTSDAERVYILEALASIVINYGQKQYLTQADYWTQEAMKLADHSKTVQGTRGAILIELGRHEEGKQTLLPLTKLGNDSIDIVMSSYYLARADHGLGNTEQAWRWLKQAKLAGKKDTDLSETLASITQELREPSKS